MNQEYPNLDPKQAALLNQRVAQNEDPVPQEIKIITTEAAPEVPKDTIIQPPSTILPEKQAQQEEAPPAAEIRPIPSESMEPPKDTVVEPPAEIFIDKQTDHLSRIKERVAQLESEVASVAIKRSDAVSTSFRDSFGNETYYVKNVSGTHIVVSDIPTMSKIPNGKVADLLESASLEELQNSRDVRKLLRDPQERYLKRLTEQQFYEERERELLQEKKMRLMAQQELTTSPNQQFQQQKEVLPHERTPVSFAQSHPIRPAIESKLGKLALKYDPNPENVKFAMTSTEFINWVNTEPLTHSEIDFIMGDPSVSKDYNIRAALLEKKRTVKE